ncbi:hypothetical protein FACS1894217_14450 [Clostridia bacterium]|nr:hypothetical protein FACS1894217_14450 [Clostridia bacterium]
MKLRGFSCVAALALSLGTANWLLLLLALPVNVLLSLLLPKQGRQSEHFGGLLSFLVGICVPIVLLVFANRAFADRMVTSLFHESPSILFLALIMVLTFLLSLGGAARFINASALFFWVVFGLLFVIAAMSLWQIKPERLAVNWDVPPLSALSVGAVFVLGGFLRPGKAWGGVVFSNAAAAVAAAITLGLLGSSLVARSDNPLFAAVSSLMVPGVMERVDAAVISLWLLADVTLMMLLITVALSVIRDLFNVRRLWIPSLIIHALVFAGAVFADKNWAATAESVCFAVIAAGVLLSFIVGLFRKRVANLAQK